MFSNGQFATSADTTFYITETQNNVCTTTNLKGVMNFDETTLLTYPGASGAFDFGANIPSTITSIGSRAFQNCSSLTSITIPSGITSIGSNAFNGCSSLLSVNLLPTTPPTLGNTFVFNNNATGRTFYIPENTYPDYSTATNWSIFASDMEEVI